MAVNNIRYEWIDLLKALAMIAVIITHTYRIIYWNYSIALHTIFSVDMFIFVAGITSALSISKLEEIKPGYLGKRILNILVPYFFATLVSYMYYYKGVFTLTIFLHYLCAFSLPAMYFIAFYIQLILVSPLLFRIISTNYNKLFRITFIFAAIYLFSLYLTKYTFVGNILFAGGKVLGGTFFFVFALGMLCYMWLPKMSGSHVHALLLPVCSLGMIFFEYKQYITQSYANPPIPLTIIYSLLLIGIVFSSYNILKEKIKYRFKIFQIFNIIGQNSLYIYLYHSLFIKIGIQYNIMSYVKINNSVCYAVWILFCAIVPPLLIAYTGKKYLKPYFKQLYFYHINQRKEHNLT